MAVKLLQNKQYLTLAASKAIETILIMAFENYTSSNSSLNTNGMIIAEKLFSALNHHLITKISQLQNRAKLVKKL